MWALDRGYLCHMSILKPLFLWKLGLRWLPNANETNTSNKKSTWPMPAPCVGDPMPPIFHLLALGVGVGGNANVSVRIGGNANFSTFGYQYVGIPSPKLWRWGSQPMPGPNMNGCASQWNIGLRKFNVPCHLIPHVICHFWDILISPNVTCRF